MLKPTRSWVASALLALVLAPAALADEPSQPAGGGAPSEAEGVLFEPGTPALADVLLKAGAEKKDVFLDFFTDS